MRIATHVKIFARSFGAKVRKPGTFVPYGMVLFFLFTYVIGDSQDWASRLFAVFAGFAVGMMPVSAAFSSEVLRLFGFSTREICKQVLVGFVLILPVVHVVHVALYLLSDSYEVMLLWLVSAATSVVGLAMRMRSAGKVATPTTFGERRARLEADKEPALQEGSAPQAMYEHVDPVRELIRKPLQKTIAIMAAVAGGFALALSLWITISAMVQQRAVDFEITFYFMFIFIAAFMVLPEVLVKAYISWKALSLTSTDFRTEPYRTLWLLIPMAVMVPTIYFLVHALMRELSSGFAEFNPAYGWGTIVTAVLVAAIASVLILLMIPLVFLLNIRWAGWGYWVSLIGGIAVITGVSGFVAATVIETEISTTTAWSIGLLAGGVLCAAAVAFYQWALPRVDLSRAGQTDTLGMRG